MELSGPGVAPAGLEGLLSFFDFFQEPVIQLLQGLFAQQQGGQVVFDQSQGHGPVDLVAVLVVFWGLLGLHLLLGKEPLEPQSPAARPAPSWQRSSPAAVHFWQS